ncbi:MAG: hypothetical protein ABDI07_08795 [Candidatus Kryptonium sp.]
MPNERSKIAESVAYWFFRLNGCFTIINFIVHRDTHDRIHSQITDIDIFAVRFPYRRELATSDKPMKDHDIFSNSKIDIILSEVKAGKCNLNSSWTKKENLIKILNALGAFKEDETETVADSLIKSGCYENQTHRIRIIAIGSEKNQEINPKVEQLTFEEILNFIYERIDEYKKVKSSHHQWDEMGQKLYNYATTLSREEFINLMLDQIKEKETQQTETEEKEEP